MFLTAYGRQAQTRMCLAGVDDEHAATLIHVRHKESAIFSHVTIGTHDLERAAAFYDATLAPLGIERVSKKYPDWCAWQRPGAETKFWVGRPYNNFQRAGATGPWSYSLLNPERPWMPHTLRLLRSEE
jgi:hypothetical protein